MRIETLKQKLGVRLKENVVIRDYVTSQVGGVVDYLTICDTIESLIEVANEVRRLGMPHVIIGQGSNVLFSDVGYQGIVIVNRSSNLSFIPEKSQVIADSGVLLSRLIMEVATRDMTGLEFFFGIRGTIGGATVNNRQANGVSIGKTIKGLTLLMPDGKVTHLPAGWMDFEHLSSRLMRLRKSDPETPLPIILTVTLQLSRNKKEEILRKIQYFGALNKQQWPLEEPSVGPIFRDPSPEQPAEAFLQGIQFKKVKVGRARIFQRNPNFILTHESGFGAGKTADIYQLVQMMKIKVLELYTQELEEAYERIGTWSEGPNFTPEID
jgi:UDP-N-acetylmuramate dehydrogenase